MGANDFSVINFSGKVGPQSSADGSESRIRSTRTGALVVAHAHGRLFEAAIRGKLYTASNVAAQAVSVALATTYTGLCISNPVGSQVNLSILGCQYALSVAPAGIASLHLIAGYSAAGVVTHTTPLAAPGIQSSIVGQAGTPGAKADSACTIVNPYYLLSMGSGFTAGALYGTTPSFIDIAGAIVVPPGGWIAWGALTAVTGFGSFLWEEVPV